MRAKIIDNPSQEKPIRMKYCSSYIHLIVEVIHGASGRVLESDTWAYTPGQVTDWDWEWFKRMED